MMEISGSGELIVVYGNYIRNMIVKKILDLIIKSGKLLKKWWFKIFGKVKFIYRNIL